MAEETEKDKPLTFAEGFNKRFPGFKIDGWEFMSPDLKKLLIHDCNSEYRDGIVLPAGLEYQYDAIYKLVEDRYLAYLENYIHILEVRAKCLKAQITAIREKLSNGYIPQ